MDIKVVTVRGQYCTLSVTLEETVGGLKHKISSHMHGQRLADMKLSYRAKYLVNDQATLAMCGFGKAKGKQMEQVFLAARFVGGGSTAKVCPPVQEIARQLRYIKKARLFGLDEIDAEDEFTWNLMLRGPKGSPYSKGRFSITIKFPENYPYGAPEICFMTPIFHPNVWPDGSLCWHSNDENGSSYFADALVGAINILLVDPNPDSPANPEAANLFNSNRHLYIQRAKEHVAEHAWF